MARARIDSILDLSTVDWPGKLASVVFMAGCNLRCPFCQNASLVSTESGELTDVSAIVQRISRNASIIDAAGFCGGEPTLQGEALLEACESSLGMGLKTFINTNGTQPEVIRRLVDNRLVSLVTIDVKAPLEVQCYQTLTGMPSVDQSLVDRVSESIRICDDESVDLEVRTTIVPSLSDGPDFVRRISQRLPKHVRYVLQQFSPEGDIIDRKLTSLSSPSVDQMRTLARVILEEGLLNVYIRTMERGQERITR